MYSRSEKKKFQVLERDQACEGGHRSEGERRAASRGQGSVLVSLLVSLAREAISAREREELLAEGKALS